MSLAKVLSASLVAVGALAFVAPHASFAAKADMKMMDPDNDGSVSMDEAKAAAGAKSDKDGTVDKAEYTAAVESAFKAADPDGDGTVDAKEMKSAKGKKLEKLLQ